MTRVLRLITRLNIGGPAIQALMLTRDLNDRYPTILGAGRSPRVEGEMRDPAVAVEYIPFVRELSPANDLRAYMTVARLLRRARPRIIHTHMAKAGAIGRMAARRIAPRARTVHTFHGHVLEGYFPGPKQRVFIAAERRLARRTDVLIAISPQTRDSLLSIGIGRPEQWRVIPLGFDLDPFLAVREPRGTFRRALGIDATALLVGVLGRLAPVKDHALLFDAIARLEDVHLAVLGDGELRARLEARATQPDLAGRVHFAGWETDVASVMSDLDVVAISSINEGTPVSLIEALASGRAVVSTLVGGVASVVDDGETGLLARGRDPAELADLIDRLLADAALRARFGEEGRERMRSRFSKARLLADISALYEELGS